MRKDNIHKSASRMSVIRLKKRFEDNRECINTATYIENREVSAKLKDWKIEFEKNKRAYNNNDPFVFNEDIFKGIAKNHSKAKQNINIIKAEEIKMPIQEDNGVIFIEDLELSKKLLEWFLWQEDLIYIVDLEEVTAKELMGRKGFGKKFLCEIKDVLSKLGMRLNENKE